MFFSSSCLVMKHEVIYYDNAIDKEGHEAELNRPNWCLSAFLPSVGVYTNQILTNTCAVKILRWLLNIHQLHLQSAN